MQEWRLSPDIELEDTSAYFDQISNQTFPEDELAMKFRALKLHEIMLEKCFRYGTTKKGKLKKNVCLIVVSHMVMVDQVSNLYDGLHKQPSQTIVPELMSDIYLNQMDLKQISADYISSEVNRGALYCSVTGGNLTITESCKEDDCPKSGKVLDQFKGYEFDFKPLFQRYKDHVENMF